MANQSTWQVILTALVGAGGGGVLLEIIRTLLNNRKDRFDEGAKIREELRTDRDNWQKRAEVADGLNDQLIQKNAELIGDNKVLANNAEYARHDLERCEAERVRMAGELNQLKVIFRQAQDAWQVERTNLQGQIEAKQKQIDQMTRQT